MAEAAVKQLQLEVNIKRMKTSEAIESLMKYVEEHQDKDLLITGFNETSKKNPYKRERLNKCTVI